MANEYELYGEVKAALDLHQGVQRNRVRLTNYRSMASAQVEPSLFELARSGKIFVASHGVVANAQVPVVDVPTTAAKYALYNNADSGSGIYLVVLEAWATVASGTNDVGASLFLGLSPTIQAAAVSAGTGTVVQPTFPTGATSKGILGTGVTLAAAAAWRNVGGSIQAAAATPGGPIGPAKLDGSYVIKPGFALGASVVSGLGTTAKYGIGFVFAEIQVAAS